MWSTGARFDRVLRPVGRSFARQDRSGLRVARWLAVLPLAAVIGFTVDGIAPAGVPTPESAEAIAPQTQGRWSMDAARDLLTAVEASAQEGLNPADYGVTSLRSAIAAGRTGPELDSLAMSSTLRLAHDYAAGRVDDKEAFDWHIETPVDLNALSTAMNEAVDRGQVSTWLQSLLPDNSQYRALRVAYAYAQGDPELRDRLRANLERWRWMPRDLGDRYIYVNVPSYRLSVIDNGVEEASYNVVVGSPKTPTPQLELHAQSIVANPGWTVPQSIIKAGGVRGKGFTWTRTADGGVRVWQAPGPNNALGRIKIDMPNPHAIYLHDTPNHAVFSREKRALSHGCVRVENIESLAAMLQRDDTRLEQALANPHQTKTFQLQKSMPVYLVYFTAQAEPDGTIRYVGDPYGRDDALLSRLGASEKSPVQVASR